MSPFGKRSAVPETPPCLYTTPHTPTPPRRTPTPPQHPPTPPLTHPHQSNTHPHHPNTLQHYTSHTHPTPPLTHPHHPNTPTPPLTHIPHTHTHTHLQSKTSKINTDVLEPLFVKRTRRCIYNYIYIHIHLNFTPRPWWRLKFQCQAKWIHTFHSSTN